MNYKTTVAALLAVTVAGYTAARVPEIDAARIDSMVADVLQEADSNPHQTHKPDGKAIRQDVLARLQSLELLKNEALKVGLDKDPAVQSRFKNMEAQFYAEQYALYLERSVEISEAELRAFYDQQTRMMQLQQVYFASEKEAYQAQELLLKGLSFEELMKRYPNPEQHIDGFITLQQLPPQLADAIAVMNRGDVSRKPFALDGRFYLFKLHNVVRNPEAQPFELVRSQLIRQLKQEKVSRQINHLLQENGIRQP